MSDIVLFTGEPNPNDVNLGTPAAVRFTYTLECSPGSFTTTGTDAQLAYQQSVSVYLYAGEATAEDVRLCDPTIQAAAGLTHYTLPAAAGTYTLTGTAATLTVARKLVCESGVYLITGTDATLTVTAGTPAVVQTGGGADWTRGRKRKRRKLRYYVLKCESGTYRTIGGEATFTIEQTLSWFDEDESFVGELMYA